MNELFIQYHTGVCFVNLLNEFKMFSCESGCPHVRFYTCCFLFGRIAVGFREYYTKGMQTLYMVAIAGRQLFVGLMIKQ